MKKRFIYALMALAICCGFASCGDDDDDNNNGNSSQIEESAVLKGLKNNQIIYDGVVADLSCSLAERIPYSDNDGAHFFSAEGEFSIGFDLGTPLVGKKIDLADPLPVVKQFQFALMGEYYGMDVYDNKVEYYMKSDDWELGSCFSSGYVVTKEDENGFTLMLEGTLTDGVSIALKSYIPRNEIFFE